MSGYQQISWALSRPGQPCRVPIGCHNGHGVAVSHGPCLEVAGAIVEAVVLLEEEVKKTPSALKTLQIIVFF